MSDPLSERRLPPPSRPYRYVGTAITFLDSVDSTNTLALRGGPDGAVFVAETQSAGRGRRGNAWESAPGLGLWLSIRLEGPLPGLGFAAALAVRDAVAPGALLAVKWPNDLLCRERKVCGILVEQRDGWAALGIGLNVHHRPEDFPPALRYRAGSLESTTDRPWDRGILLGALLNRLDRMIDRLRQGEYDAVRTEWIDACGIVGRYIRRSNIAGRVTAVDRDGALLVQTPSGVHRLDGGEIYIAGG